MMIKNWNTIEKIAKYAQQCRISASVASTAHVKKMAQAAARMWETLIRKFADSCLAVETYIVSVINHPTWAKTYVQAVSSEVAVRIMQRVFAEILPTQYIVLAVALKKNKNKY